MARKEACRCGRRCRADLAGDDAGERQRRRLQVGVVKGCPWASRVARVPASAEEADKEAPEHQGGGDAAQQQPRAHQEGPVDDA